MAYVTKGQGIAAIVLGILKLLMGIVIIIIGFVMAGKSDNATLSMYWGGFIVSSSFIKHDIFTALHLTGFYVEHVAFNEVNV